MRLKNRGRQRDQKRKVQSGGKSESDLKFKEQNSNRRLIKNNLSRAHPNQSHLLEHLNSKMRRRLTLNNKNFRFHCYSVGSFHFVLLLFCLVFLFIYLFINTINEAQRLIMMMKSTMKIKSEIKQKKNTHTYRELFLIGCCVKKMMNNNNSSSKNRKSNGTKVI